MDIVEISIKEHLSHKAICNDVSEGGKLSLTGISVNFLQYFNEVTLSRWASTVFLNTTV